MLPFGYQLINYLKPNSLEAAAAQATFAFGRDLTDDFIKIEGADPLDIREK